MAHAIAGPVAHAGLQAQLADRLEAEGLVVRVGRLLGVADLILDVIESADGKEIV